MAMRKGIERRENTNVERTFGVGPGLAMIRLMKVGSLTRHRSRAVESSGAAGRIPGRLNAAGWVTVDLRRVMVSVMKVYR